MKRKYIQVRGHTPNFSYSNKELKSKGMSFTVCVPAKLLKDLLLAQPPKLLRERRLRTKPILLLIPSGPCWTCYCDTNCCLAAGHAPTAAATAENWRNSGYVIGKTPLKTGSKYFWFEMNAGIHPLCW